jgi:hypothetical protein
MSSRVNTEFSGSLSIAIEKFSCKVPRLKAREFPAQRLYQRRADGSDGPTGRFPKSLIVKVSLWRCTASRQRATGLWLHESARAKEVDRLVGSLPQRKIGEHFAKNARELEAVPRTRRGDDDL